MYTIIQQNADHHNTLHSQINLHLSVMMTYQCTQGINDNIFKAILLAVFFLLTLDNLELNYHNFFSHILTLFN